MKVKLFTQEDEDQDKLEKDINKWLAKHPNLKIEHIKTSGNDYRFCVFVFYTEASEDIKL